MNFERRTTIQRFFPGLERGFGFVFCYDKGVNQI